MHTVLITGAASGLGWELARAYHSHGCNLLLTDINTEGLATRVAELGAEHVLGLAGDITEPALHQQLLQACAERFGGLDILINNAGITHRSPTTQTDPAALPLLRKSRGQIIAIGSMAGWMPVLGRAGYCAAKSALSQFFEVLRAEVVRDGIRMLLVYPSFLDTPIDLNALGADGQRAKHGRSTIGTIRGADWMAVQIIQAQQQGLQRLFPDRSSWLASLLWRIAPSFYYRKMSARFAAEMD